LPGSLGPRESSKSVVPVHVAVAVKVNEYVNDQVKDDVKTRVCCVRDTPYARSARLKGLYRAPQAVEER
jgi:hypothetical protein